MKKLQSLREHLLRRIPILQKNPDRLLTFIEDGTIEFHRGSNLSHQYSVPVRIVLTDMAGDTDLIMLPLLQWLNHYQPDLIPAEAIRFQAELLSNSSWDLAIEVTLTERVVARVDCQSSEIRIEHRMPEFPVDPCSSQNWQLFMRNAEIDPEYTLVAEWGPDGSEWIA